MKKIFIFMTFGALFYVSSCQTKNELEEEETKFIATSPLVKDTTIIKDYVCQIHAISHIELRALERGYLESIYVDEGQFVKKGQKMFQIMPLMYQAEMQKAQAEVNYVQIEYQNTKSLADRDIVSKNELALAKAKLDKAKAELNMAQVHLGFTLIKAPFDGVMDRFQVRLGSLLEEGDLLSSLADNSKMWVYFNVPEAEYLDYKSKIDKNHLMKVKLLMANNQLFDYEGTVEAIEADFNNETGNIAFRATFPNPKLLLRHGETGNIKMTKAVKEGLIIPQKATYEILEKKYVFVIDKNNVVHSKEIIIDSELPDLYIIKSGLNKNDKIILEGIRKVKDGQKIHFAYEKPEKVLKNLKIYVE